MLVCSINLDNWIRQADLLGTPPEGILDSLGVVRWVITNEYSILLTIMTFHDPSSFESMMLVGPQQPDEPAAGIKRWHQHYLYPRRCLAPADQLKDVIGMLCFLFLAMVLKWSWEVPKNLEVQTNLAWTRSSPSLMPATPQSTMKSSYRSGKVPTGEQGTRRCMLVVAPLLELQVVAALGPWPFAQTFLVYFSHHVSTSSLPLSLLRRSPDCQEFLQHSWPPNLHSSPIIGQSRHLKVSRERAAATLITALLTQSQTVQNSLCTALNSDRNRPPRVYLTMMVSLSHYAETCRPCWRWWWLQWWQPWQQQWLWNDDNNDSDKML